MSEYDQQEELRRLKRATDQRLGAVLSSDDTDLIIRWLSHWMVENAELPPLDDGSRVDPHALSFRAGQLSVLNRIRNKRDELNAPRGE